MTTRLRACALLHTLPNITEQSAIHSRMSGDSNRVFIHALMHDLAIRFPSGENYGETASAWARAIAAVYAKLALADGCAYGVLSAACCSFDCVL